MKKAEPPTELSLRVCSKRLNDDSPSWSSKTYCVLSGIIQSVQGLLDIGYRSVIKREGEILSNERKNKFRNT